MRIYSREGGRRYTLQRPQINNVMSTVRFFLTDVKTKTNKFYRAFSCDVIAAMLDGKNNAFSLLWEIRSIFMQNCFIVSALRENPLYTPLVSISCTYQCQHTVVETSFLLSYAYFCLLLPFFLHAESPLVFSLFG